MPSPFPGMDPYQQRALPKSINYRETPPPPAFTAEELEWMEAIAARSTT